MDGRKRIAMTGHTSGVGQALYDYWRGRGHDVQGFSRSNGYDLSRAETITRVVQESLKCDWFINNAFNEWAQIDLLYALFEKWRDQERWILNIGSNSPDRTKGFPHKYQSVKAALDVACAQLNHIQGARCRVSCLRPGWIRTPRIADLKVNEPMLVTADICATVAWLAALPPHVHVPMLTLQATDRTR
ncbi:MAG TPA: hypothetical protein PKC28_14885 [Bdellovibrionales bacterium]|nr:hypothetical protein [Bdellovibrionales bacterium]